MIWVLVVLSAAAQLLTVLVEEGCFWAVPVTRIAVGLILYSLVLIHFLPVGETSTIAQVKPVRKKANPVAIITREIIGGTIRDQLQQEGTLAVKS